ncbi:MAG TPA: VRR-NUC domain-containing protein [Noviherbaspirillum sp.]|uniref:VRR-NUC domain-containing protein n=1 Tax=Noviherbaspirillum sp. TaxID=1926288 RepID=UPI002B497D22|nr:VRR-NUC domain-containing protein [Noviherbaspirillum sp.]HJV84930.1 VRR-NUC domain-containing protein [Noviherbaspirillum sp.]
MNRTPDKPLNPLNPLYYLDNFHQVLAWIAERYNDLLSAEERAFLDRFPSLPQASRALLVRMVMRKGNLFRASKLRYEEIGDTREAALPLAAQGWIDDRPVLTLDEIFSLLNKSEIAVAFGDALPSPQARKLEQLETLREKYTQARHFDAWHAGADDCVYQVQIDALCERLRLMFFGNLRQDWTEFVLSDLGIYRYEKVAFSASSRGFRMREDVDMYMHLFRCRERFEQGEAPEIILSEIPAKRLDNDWLERRRAKLLYQIAQHDERAGALTDALAIYSACSHPGARLRAIRVMERLEQFESALALAKTAQKMPEDEAERQQLMRILPRLHRKLGLPKIPALPARSVPRIDLDLPEASYSVEWLVAEHLVQDDAPVFYVENTLINSLFGLLCWNAVFAAVPGAFFHPFHAGPADLHSTDFRQRRAKEFDTCLAQLESGEYVQTINRHFAEKSGILSPFVFWDVLSEELKDLALDCIPASHLKKCFERMLRDIKANRAGFPDLIQFWPMEKHYRMIEVKGPGDRLQDNQVRWMDFCIEHGMPVSVCYVRWAGDAA